VIAIIGHVVHSGPFSRTIVELLVRVMLVVGLYIFVGNSGIISFGHVGFMCIGAYATAWFTIAPMMKAITLPGLPSALQEARLPFIVAVLLAALLASLVAFVFGMILIRLSGIAASIGTFAMLAVINTVYANWTSVTGGTSTIGGIPMYTGIWTALIGAVFVIIVAWLHAVSRSGLALRAGREDATAAAASGVNIDRDRLIAFVVSAFVIGLSGALYAHFLGIVNPDAFYLVLTFVGLSMLIIGGMNSLSGAVVGVVVISTIIQVLRWFEKGIEVGNKTYAIPNGAQEIAIGLIMIVILMFRPAGLMGSNELSWRYLRVVIKKARGWVTGWARDAFRGSTATSTAEEKGR
jgi:branched-chain amino acid transport system permease protein